MKIHELLSPWFEAGPQSVRRRTFIAAGAALSIAAGASGASIGVTFVATGDHVNNTNATSLAASDSAGASPYTQANWNNLGRWGDTVTLNDSSGASSGVSIAWDATGTWSQQGNPAGLSNQGSPDLNLMDGYDDSNGNNLNGNNNSTNAYAVLNPSLYANSGNNKPLIYVSGLGTWLAAQGASLYDVVIYVDGDATANRIGEYWLYGASGDYTNMTFTSDLTSHVVIRDPANFLTIPSYTQVPLISNRGLSAAAGNYAVFESLSADSFILRAEEFGYGGTRRCPINAFQIVPRFTAGPAPTLDPAQPAPAQLYNGKTARFTVNPAGRTPFTYQWLKNGNPLSDGGNISGSSSASLTIANASGLDVAPYSVIVSNVFGSVTSSVAPLTLTSPAVGSFAEKIVTNNAYAYWRFNDPGDPSTNAPIADLIGGFNGTYANAAQGGFNSIVGPRPSFYPGFEGGNSAMQSANGTYWTWATLPPLNLNTNAATLCAWIFPTTNQPANTGIITTRNGTEFGGLNFAAGNQLQYAWNTNATTAVSFTSPALIVPSNQWSFVAVVISSSNAILFLFNTNAVVTLTNTLPATASHIPISFNGTTWIGDDQNTAGRAFSGFIDEVAIFNYSLNPAEVSGLYKRALGLTAIPPLISKHPLPLALLGGRRAKFDVSASGDAPLSYHWRRGGNDLSNGGNLSGVFSPSLTVSNVVAGVDDLDYDVVVANFAGSLTSNPAHLSVVASNSFPAPYEAAVRAANPIAYWRLNETSGSLAYDYWGGNIAAHTNVTLGVAGPQPADYVGLESTNVGAQYDLLNSSATESSVSLMNNRAQFSLVGWFNSPGTQPARTGLFGQNDAAEFGFHGNGDLGIWTPNGGFAFMPQSFVNPNQWYMVAAVGNGANLYLYLFGTNGIIQTNVTVSTTNYGSSVFPFRIGGNGILDDAPTNFFTGVIDEVAVFDRAVSLGELSGMWGAALSGTPTLAPSVTVQPISVTLYAGRTAQFAVTVAGSTPLTYQWRKGGNPISDAGNVLGTGTATLTITNVNSGNIGDYDLVAANSVNSVTSQVATLNVIVPVPGSYEAVSIANNPLAYWRLNELSGTTAFDYFGGHDGAYQSAATQGVGGVTNPPFSGFEATNTAVQTFISTANSYVTVPFGTIGTNTFSFTAWLYPIGLQESWAGLLVNRGGGINGGFNYNDQQMLGYTWNNNSAATYNFVSGLVIPTNQWSFVAVVISPTNAILYLIDGATVRTATNVLAHTSDVFGNNWQIGHDNNSGNNNGTRNYNGIIDEVAIYMRSLSPAEVLQTYSASGIPLVTLNIQLLGNSVVLTWPVGILQQADFVNGPYSDMIGITSPYTNALPIGQKFYRVKAK